MSDHKAYYFGIRLSVYPQRYNPIEFDFYQGYYAEPFGELTESYVSIFGCGHQARFFLNTFGVQLCHNP